jgi:hypothetical protein
MEWLGTRDISRTRISEARAQVMQLYLWIAVESFLSVMASLLVLLRAVETPVAACKNYFRCPGEHHAVQAAQGGLNESIVRI